MDSQQSELVNIAIRDTFYDLDARDFCLLAVLIVFLGIFFSLHSSMSITRIFFQI